jgi:uncharacterized membrane protein YfcA
MLYSWFIAIVIFFASVTSGTAGFGFALVSMPFISLVVSPKLAVPFIILYGYGINIFFLLFRFKEYVDWQKLLPLVWGALPGIPLGIYFLKNYDDVIIKKIVGGVVIVFALSKLLVRVDRKNGLSRFWGYLAGFASGILSGGTSMGGPPVLMYLTLNRWGKTLTRATLQSFFFVVGTCSLLGLTIARLLTLSVLRLNILYRPAVVLGNAAGYLLFKRLSSELFNRVLLCLLLVLGFLLVFA